MPIAGVFADSADVISESCTFTKKVQVYDLIEYPYYVFSKSEKRISNPPVYNCSATKDLAEFLKNAIVEKHKNNNYDIKRYVKEIKDIKVESCRIITPNKTSENKLIAVQISINPNSENWYKPKYTSVIANVEGAYKWLADCIYLQDKSYCTIAAICDYNEDNELDVVIYQSYASGGDKFIACSTEECKSFSGGKIH